MCDRGRIASGAGTLNPGGLWGPGWDSLPSILKQRTREDPWAGRLNSGSTTSTCIIQLYASFPSEKETMGICTTEEE